ncbi:hypothetical protein CVT25_015729 [Psilocybe cyanescens]|uniref:rRNA-processing protein FYV7 n=1 Tax=Psilocybe cyanescens TaxID=93625 RepID=A0A409WRP3_PSICY|nr:hypothetical protein CVT25_015729 [Psilocybe cyanescens]
MADSASAGAKRKKPPTFQHYPTNRAKVLKKAWVEKTKIKSKWKAEKKKEDLTSSYKLEIPVYGDDEDDSNDTKSAKFGQDLSRKTDEETPLRQTTSKMEPSQHHLHPSRAHNHLDLPVKRTNSMQSNPEPRPAKRQRVSKEKEEVKAAEPASLRDLTRVAYSRSTLHTYKTDPLKKKYSTPKHGGKSGNRRREEAGTGRGQPNMKLRMNAMLAKIKQDLA